VSGPKPQAKPVAKPQRISFVPQIVLGLLASAGLYIAFTLPAQTTRLADPTPDPRAVAGGYHIHSNRSDGTGTPDEIAAAAARAGLRFIVLTDHGDATRAPDPPQYRHGVLCIDAAEISTASGHVVALGLERASPYPLAGEAADVIDDIHRLGGWAVIAHPDSPKPELRWRGTNAPYDGIEWLNIDSEWRDESIGHLAGTFVRYFVRAPPTIASLFQRPVATLRRWDSAARTRAVVGLAALDAHARLPWRARQDPSPGGGTLAALPSYVQMFRTLAQIAVLDRPLSGDARGDARLVMAALRAGHTYSAVTALAAPASLSFSASENGTTISMGELVGPIGASAGFHARVNDASARVAILHNGVEIAGGRGRAEFSGAITPGPYRVEAYRPGLTVPWMVSNPIYAGRGADLPGPETRAALAALRFVALPAGSGWAVEKNSTSTGAVADDQGAARFSFSLGPGLPAGQFAALATSLDASTADEGFDRVRFTVRADRPMRLSVQVRLPGRGAAGQRWRHSVYADQTPRSVEVNLQDFQPADAATSQRPVVAHVRSVLFVVDTINTATSTAGTLWVSEAALGVGNPER
jgi:hypothetical protein